MKEEFLKKLPFWNYIQKEEQQRLLEGVRIQTFQQGDLLYSPAKDCLGILIVEEGSLRTCIVSEDGRKVTIFRIRREEVCILSMSCALPTITFDVEVEAETQGEAIVLPTVLMSKLSKENIYVENFIYKEGVERFSEVMEAVQKMFFLTLEQRIAAFLLDESAEEQTEELIVTKEQLAVSIGSAREAVSRGLKQLAKEGLIEVLRGKIRIHNKKGLYEKI